MPRNVNPIPTLLPLDSLSEDHKRPPNPDRLANRRSRKPWIQHAAWWLHKARQVQIDFEKGETEISDETRAGLEAFFSHPQLQTALQGLSAFNTSQVRVKNVIGSTETIREIVEDCEDFWRLSKVLATRRVAGEELWTRPPEGSGLKSRVPEAALSQRRETFRAITSWMGPGGQRILWIRDADGHTACGKSVVTHFVARNAWSSRNFPQDMCFGDEEERDEQELRNHLIATLAADFTMRLEYGTVVKVLDTMCSRHCQSESPEFFGWSLRDQFQNVLLPALNLEKLMDAERQPLLIILDDIHKCHPNSLDELFQMMKMSLSSNLPFHFLVSGRATPRVRAGLDGGAGCALAAYVTTVDVPPFIPHNEAEQAKPDARKVEVQEEKRREEEQDEGQGQEEAKEREGKEEGEKGVKDRALTPTGKDIPILFDELYKDGFNPTASVSSEYSYIDVSGNASDAASIRSSTSGWTTMAHPGSSSEAISELSADGSVLQGMPHPSTMTAQERSDASSIATVADNTLRALLGYLRKK
ncbi:hypothetical protein BKA70DRAFT_1328950 [Coprinopsis sp. MPI-PUGE-AT-0042]|nr:hypothetical protein BKA70DRAFT_1328950 [Coprinopsis sp. MPI-PUGE-AT-0042]